MIDKELIESYRKIVKPVVASRLFNINYENMGEQDKEEFERDFDEILDLALIGLKYKSTTKDATSDTISSQAAIDALDVLCQEHRYKIPGKGETYSEYNEAWQDALDRAEGIIFNLPSAQPELKWIPCSERLPRQGQEVICQCRANIIKILKLDTDGDWYQDADHCYMSGFVIAWMPLPDPYQESEGGS